MKTPKTQNTNFDHFEKIYVFSFGTNLKFFLDFELYKRG